jgi:predicted GH43/DUF377 family glycosyl hydrolase
MAEDWPAALRGFQQMNEQPVFTGKTGAWDELIRERGWILRDGAVWKMWYTGYVESDQPRKMKLGYATSDDGNHWNRSQTNPVFDDAWVEDMMVVKRDGKYFMFAEGVQDQAQLLTSDDGLQWTRVGALDVRLTSGQPIPAGPYGTPTAWFEDGVWNLFYERRDQGVWLARSRDMQVWTNVSDEPLIKPGPEPYDRLMIAMNQIVRVDGRYYAVLHGTGTPTKPRDWCTYLAVSDDLINWTKDPAGPLLPIKSNRSSGLLIEVDGQYRLYTMHGRVDVHSIPEPTR